MKCPDCGIDMERLPIERKKEFFNEEITLNYFIFSCPKCNEEYLDSDSLENALHEVWNRKMQQYKSLCEFNDIENFIIDLVELRSKYKITICDMAKLLNISKSKYNKFENCVRRKIIKKILKKRNMED